MNRSRWLAASCLLCAAAAIGLPGCGGGQAEGPSLNKQYEDALKIPAAYPRASRLIGIASQQIKKNNEIGADKTLTSAAAAADKIDNADQRADVYLSIFAIRATTGQAVVSKDLLKEAAKATDEIELQGQKFGKLLRLAEAYARDLEKQATASGHLAKAEEILAQLSDTEQLQANIQLSGTLAVTGDADRSQQLLDSTIEAARQLEDVRKKSDLLGQAAALLFELDRGSDAQPLLDEASGVASGIKDPEGRAFALASLGRQLMLASQAARASGFLKQAQSAAEEVGDPAMRSSIMDEIAGTRKLMN